MESVVSRGSRGSVPRSMFEDLQKDVQALRQQAERNVYSNQAFEFRFGMEQERWQREARAMYDLGAQQAMEARSLRGSCPSDPGNRQESQGSRSSSPAARARQYVAEAAARTWSGIFGPAPEAVQSPTMMMPQKWSQLFLERKKGIPVGILQARAQGWRVLPLG